MHNLIAIMYQDQRHSSASLHEQRTLDLHLIYHGCLDFTPLPQLQSNTLLLFISHQRGTTAQSTEDEGTHCRLLAIPVSGAGAFLWQLAAVYYGYLSPSEGDFS